MKYKVGDNVVHMSHGVGVIHSIETREFPGGKQTFYIVHIEDNGASKKVFVPFETAITRMRTIIDKETVERVYSELRNKTSPGIDHQTWNRRYREYMELIHSGDAVNIARVLRALYTLKLDKDLSFGERKLLEQAQSLLVQELAIAQTLSINAAEKKILDALNG
jgi:CarD family transcriptional regulator